MLSHLRLIILTLAFALLATTVSADDTPWRRRRRKGIRPSVRSTELVKLSDWKRQEPRSPKNVDPAKFAKALRKLCGWMPKGRPARWTGYVLDASKEFDIDPFLLAGLLHRMGRCDNKADSLSGYGLTLIAPQMYGEFLKKGKLKYWVKGKSEGWKPRSLNVNRFPFTQHRLMLPKENLYFAAAFLAAWKAQHQEIDASFEQAEHRHYVSHFIWGDKVRSARGEDRILTDRRRMLQYYGAYSAPKAISFRGYRLAPPLDGAPRVVSSWIGAVRENGKRSHRGIDVESVLGEPVYAVEDGLVNFAGVDLPGHRNSQNLKKSEYKKYPNSDLGSGGRYVCVLHRGGKGWLRSCYMHLLDVDVEHGQKVKRGDKIGTVGRTGMKRSAAHLHFELHAKDELLDASKIMKGTLIGHNPDKPKKRKRRRKK